jgi:hypothetical protein
MNNLKNYDEYLNEGRVKNLALVTGLAATMCLSSCCDGGDHLAYDVVKNEPIEMADFGNKTIYGKVLNVRDKHVSTYRHYAVVLIKGKDGVVYKVVLDDSRNFWNNWPVNKGNSVALIVQNGDGYMKLGDKYFPLKTDAWGRVENDAENYQKPPKETKTKDQW